MKCFKNGVFDNPASECQDQHGHWLLTSLLAAIILLGSALSAEPATYYVDFSSGSDANNGTSTQTSWKHCPGDAAAGGTPAGARLNPGDAVVFRGGVVYSITNTSGIVIANSGTQASPIVYDGTGNAWGTGRAILDGGYVANETAIIVNTKVGYVTIEGFQIQNVSGYSDTASNVLSAAAGTYTNEANTQGLGIDCSSGYNTNITISGLLIDRIGQWRNTQGWDGPSVSGAAIVASGCTGLIITNCEITECGNAGIGLYADPNFINGIVSGCNIHDNIKWGMDVATTGDASDIFNGLMITNTRFVDLNAFGGAAWQGPNADQIHQDYLFIRSAGSLTPWTNVIVCSCFFGDTNLIPAGSGGTAAIYMSQGTSANIYNNVFANEWSIDGAIFIYGNGGPASVINIFNNTFYHGDDGACITVESNASNKYNVLNNLFINSLENTSRNLIDLNIDAADGMPAQLNYDIYYSPLFAESVGNIGVYYTLTYLQTTLNYEANGFWANPLLVNPEPPTLNCAISAGSPALGAGTNLSAYFRTDIAGNPRPATGNWTIGAYQTVSGGVVATTVSLTYSPSNSVASSSNPASQTIPIPTTAILTWSTANATNVTLSGFGAVPPSGTTNAPVSQATNYILTASGAGGTSSTNMTIPYPTPPTSLNTSP